MVPLPDQAENWPGGFREEKKFLKYKDYVRGLFQAETSPLAAFEKMLGELQKEESRLYRDMLFEWCTLAPAFDRKSRSGKKYQEFISQWVLRAVSEEDVEISRLYSRFYPDIRPLNRYWARFNLLSNRLMPGDTLDMSSYTLHGMRGIKESFQVRVEKSVLNGPGVPARYLLADSGAMVSKGRTVRYSTVIAEPGFYRIKVFNAHFFQQFLVQVSSIQAVVKADHRTLVVWGASLSDSLQPPYQVTAFLEGGQGVQSRTDSSGICIFTRSPKAAGPVPFSVLLEKDGHSVFVQGRFSASSGPVPAYAWMVMTDRARYLPGDQIRLHGFVKSSGPEGLGDAGHDSAEVSISDMSDARVYQRVLPVSRFGMFGDSLSLPASIQTGSYRISCRFSGPVPADGPGQSRGDGAAAVFIVESPEKAAARFQIQAEKNILPDGIPAVVNIIRRSDASLEIGTPVFISWSVSPAAAEFIWYPDREPAMRMVPGLPEVLLKIDTAVVPPAGKIRLKYRAEYPAPMYFLTARAWTAGQDGRQKPEGETRIKVAGRDVAAGIAVSLAEIQVGDTAVLCYSAVSLFTPFEPDQLELFILHDGDTCLQRTVKVAGLGKGRLPFVPEKAGKYHAGIVLKDSRGLLVTAETEFYAFRRRGENWPPERLSISADRPFYSRRDTAVITLRSSMEGAKVFFSAGHHLFRYIDAQRVNGGKAVFRVPVEHVAQEPVFDFHVPGAAGAVSASFFLTISDSAGLVHANLSGTRRLSPGDGFRGRLQITDFSGRPCKGEFAVVAADARLDLGKTLTGEEAGFFHKAAAETGVQDEIRNFLGETVLEGVNTFDGFLMDDNSLLLSENPDMFWRSFQALQRARMKVMNRQIRSSGLKNARALIMPRSADALLQKTAVREQGEGLPAGQAGRVIYRAFRTDDSGRAGLDIDVPGTYNAWDVFIMGSTARGTFFYSDKIEIEQNLVVDFKVPRKLSQGDTAEAVSSIWNQADRTVECRVKLSAAGGRAVLSGDSIQILSIGPGEHSTARWSVTARTAGAEILAVEVMAGFYVYADSARLEISGSEKRISSVSSAFMPPLEKAGKLYYRADADFPDMSTPETRGLQISCFYNLEGLLLDIAGAGGEEPALNTAARISGFLPQLELAAAMKPGTAKDSLQNVMVRRLVPETGLLAQLQNGDGGWAWADPGPSDARTTAYVLRGMGAARGLLEAAWGPENERSLQRGIQWALSRLKIQDEDDNARVFLMYALGGVSDIRIFESAARGMISQKDRLSSYGLAMLMEIAWKAGWNAETDTLLALLERRCLNLGLEASWNGDFRDAWFMHGAEATAQAMYSILKVRPAHPLADRALRFISRKRDGSTWICPKTGEVVVRALAEYVKIRESPQAGFTGKIFLNGKKVRQFMVSETGTLDSSAVFTAAAADILKSNRIVLGFEGLGPLYYSVKTFYTSPVVLPAAAWNELALSRQYRRLIYEEKEDGTWQQVAVPADSGLVPGEELEVRLHIKTFRDYEYLVVSDHLPEGFTFSGRAVAPEGSGRKTPAPVRDSDGNVIFYIARLPEGEHELVYSGRAVTPGRYHAPPAEAALEYEPAVRCFSEAHSLRIHSE